MDNNSTQDVESARQREKKCTQKLYRNELENLESISYNHI